MDTMKIGISLKENLLDKIDRLVRNKIFESRSAAFQIAIEEKIKSIEKIQLSEECSKLDIDFERNMANDDLCSSNEWPEY